MFIWDRLHALYSKKNFVGRELGIIKPYISNGYMANGRH